MTCFGGVRLAQVHPDLRALVLDVSTSTDVVVVQGARSLEDEERAIAYGKSALRDPAASKHVLTSTRTLAEAVDVAPFPVEWSNIPRFYSLASLMFARASALSVNLTWGGHWLHLKDFDHFELA